MTPLLARLKQYTQWQADGIAEAEAQRVVIATLERLRRPPSPRRQWRNAASALAAALLVTGGLVLLQLRQSSHGPVTQPAAEIPDDSITLSSYLGLQTFRLRNRTLSAPEGAWRVANRAQLDISNRTDCSTSVIRVIDPVTKSNLRGPVILTGCFDSIGQQPLVLPDSTVLLNHYRILPSRPPRPGEDVGPPTYVDPLGAVRYDWQAGRTVQFYPGLDPTVDVVLSPDARRLYVLQDSGGSGVMIDCNQPPCGTVVHDRVRAIDLQTGTTLMQFDGASRFTTMAGGGPSRIALSPDGRTLYLNESAELRIFSTVVAGPPQVVLLNPDHPLTSVRLAGQRWVVDAAAKEWGGPAVAADPSGRWVVSLSRAYAYPGQPYINNERDLGFWVVNLEGQPHVIGYFHRSDGFRSVAASSDGRVIYLLEEAGRGRYLLMVDPATGKDLGEILLCTSTACQGFDGITGVTPADQ